MFGRVALHEDDMAKTGRANGGTSLSEHPGREVHADDAAGGVDTPGERDRGEPCPCGRVEHAVAGPDGRGLDELGGVGAVPLAFRVVRRAPVERGGDGLTILGHPVPGPGL